MYHKNRKFKVIVLFFLSLFIFFSNQIQAMQHRSKLWSGINIQTALGQKTGDNRISKNESKWLISVISQLHFVKQTHPFQTALIETSLGRELGDNNSLWIGYRFVKHIYNRPSFQESRLIQQWITNRKSCSVHCGFRTRLEESYRSNRRQAWLRFRHRISLEFPLQICNKINPYFFNEVFIMLNKTLYTSRKVIGENRLFVGLNYYYQKAAWWELGYIMQYRSNIPLNRHRQLNHILSINYNYR